jgi:hypothetical protein
MRQNKVVQVFLILKEVHTISGQVQPEKCFPISMLQYSRERISEGTLNMIEGLTNTPGWEVLKKMAELQKAGYKPLATEGDPKHFELIGKFISAVSTGVDTHLIAILKMQIAGNEPVVNSGLLPKIGTT